MRSRESKRKITEIGDSTGVVIPPIYLDLLDVEKGDYVEWDYKENGGRPTLVLQEVE